MYQSHSKTSREAYKNTDRTRVSDRIFSFIESQRTEGTTAGWIAYKLSMQTGSVAARLIELERRGRIVKLKREKQNPSGKNGNVYISAELLKMALMQGDQVETTKAEEAKGEDADALLRECLRKIEARVDMGWNIPAGGDLHREMKTLLGIR